MPYSNSISLIYLSAHSKLIWSQLKVHSSQLDGLAPFISRSSLEAESYELEKIPLPVDGLSKMVHSRLEELSTKASTEKEQAALRFLCHISSTPQSLHLSRTEESNNDTSQPFRFLDSGSEGGLRWYKTDPLISMVRSRVLHPSRKSISWGLSVYHLPIGTLRIERSVKRKGPTESSYEAHVHFGLYPSTWLANKVINISLGLSGDFVAPVCSLRLEVYNQDPALLRALHSGDIQGLKNPFLKGMARPTDIIAPRGNTLLHVSCF
jgi:hypothetical protein